MNTMKEISAQVKELRTFVKNLMLFTKNGGKPGLGDVTMIKRMVEDLNRLVERQEPISQLST